MQQKIKSLLASRKASKNTTIFIKWCLAFKAQRQNADTAQRVRQYGKELWIMTWTPEVGLTTPENLKKIHPFHPDALLINDVTMLRS